MGRLPQNALLGAGLVVLYTAMISGADAITKLLAGGYAAAQLYALSGGLVAVLCLLAGRRAGPERRLRESLRTRCPRAMALRAAATVLAAVCFFYAFRLLPFAEVFLFIGLMPLLAGLMSGPLLGERVRPAAWAALAAGFAGMLFLFPGGIAAVTPGHGIALLAAVSGTLSMTLARYIGRYEKNALAQVFYPNLALCLVMAVALPLVWQPMPLADVLWAAAYAVLLFGGRWLLVVALRLLPAYAATPLMNLQFAWMAVMGAALFGEYPPASTYAGAAVVIGSGLYLLWEQLLPQAAPRPARGRLRTDP
ncbi:DMT family transporter [Roseobacteraceae bacterium NS-SX3]